MAAIDLEPARAPRNLTALWTVVLILSLAVSTALLAAGPLLAARMMSPGRFGGRGGRVGPGGPGGPGRFERIAPPRQLPVPIRPVSSH